MRNGIPYGGNPAIDSEKNEVIIGDGDKWAKGSQFFTNVIVGYPGGVTDSTYEPLPEDYTGTFYLRISSIPEDGITITSIKLANKDDEDEVEELINEENLAALVNQEEAPLFIECDDIEMVEGPDSETYTITKDKKTCLLQINPDDPKIIVKKSTGGTSSQKFTFKLKKSKPKKITVTVEKGSNLYSVIDKNPWIVTDNTLAKGSNDNNSISFDTDKILFIQKRIGSELAMDDISDETNSTTPVLMFSGQVKKYSVEKPQAALSLSEHATITGSNLGHLLFKDKSNIHFEGQSALFASGRSVTQFTGEAQLLTTGNSNTTFKDNSITTIGDHAQIYADGNTRFTLHNSAWLDVNQDAEVKFGQKARVYVDHAGDKNSELFIHGGRIELTNNGGNQNAHPWANKTTNDTFPLLELHDQFVMTASGSSFLKMTDNSSLVLTQDSEIFMAGKDTLSPYLVGNTQQIMMGVKRKNNNNFNLYNTLHSNPKLNYQKITSTLQPSHTSIIDTLHTTDWANSNNNNSVSSDHHLVSIIQGSNTEIRIGGGNSSSSPDTDTINNGLTKIYAGADKNAKLIYDLTTAENSISSIRYGASKGAKVHLDIGAGKDNESDNSSSECIVRLHPAGKLYVNATPPQSSTALIELQPNENGKIAYLLQGDNIFVQHTGNFHAEFHDSSTIIMRGAEQFYEEDGQAQSYPNNNKKPWNDGEQWSGWRRPVLSREKSPIIGMYDGSNFIMRGAWDLALDLYTNKTLEFTVEQNDSDFANEQEEELDYDTVKNKESFKKAERDNNIYVTGALKSESPPESNGKLKVTKTSLGSDGWKIKIENFTSTTKPHDWTPHIPHQLYQPTLEVIENAEIRLGGFIYIKAGTYAKKTENNGEPDLTKEYPFFNEADLDSSVEKSSSTSYKKPSEVKDKVVTAITIGSNIPKDETTIATNGEDEDQVTFTIEDLKKLKEIINNKEVIETLKQSKT